MSAMGLPEGRYSFGDVGEVEVVGGDRAYRAGTTTLAGAVVPLDECVRRFLKYADCGIVEALEAASLHPAQALGIESRKGSLEPGADADIVMLDASLHVCRCYIAGEQVWPMKHEEVANSEEVANGEEIANGGASKRQKTRAV
jgi:N-acetylglucosamine-6-phosphate deacetylase